MATPGLNWFVGKAVHSFAGSMYAQKSPESQELLERRCEQVAATGEHLVGVDGRESAEEAVSTVVLSERRLRLHAVTRREGDAGQDLINSVFYRLEFC